MGPQLLPWQLPQLPQSWGGETQLRVPPDPERLRVWGRGGRSQVPAGGGWSLLCPSVLCGCGLETEPL